MIGVLLSKILEAPGMGDNKLYSYIVISSVDIMEFVNKLDTFTIH